ncbi:MAG: septal ring lytic transglycosylase RlpA family protein [Spirochaetota bacterium]
MTRYERHRRWLLGCSWLLALLAGLPVAAAAEGSQQADLADEHEVEGGASWYAGKFQGRTTANGEVFDTNELTAAHKTLPFGTVVRVTNLKNGLDVEVRINDRGPFVEGRIIDLSRAAADAIDMTADGVVPVSLTVVTVPEEPLRRIQVASFTSSDNANRKLARLRTNGLDAKMEPAGSLYRVVIAGVAAEDVEEIVGRLARLGYPDALVRVEESR